MEFQVELKYIEANTDCHSRKKPPPLPIVSILTSIPIWATQIALIGFSWVAYTMMTLTPLYLSTIQNVPESIVSFNIL